MQSLSRPNLPLYDGRVDVLEEAAAVAVVPAPDQARASVEEHPAVRGAHALERGNLARGGRTEAVREPHGSRA